MQKPPVTLVGINGFLSERLAQGVFPDVATHSSKTMRTPRVDGRGVFSATLADELVEAVAEVLHLAGSEDTTHPHQVAVVRMVVVMVVSATIPCVGITSSPNSPGRLRSIAGFGPGQAWQDGFHSR